jgi:PPM family protein phosphatase
VVEQVSQWTVRRGGLHFAVAAGSQIGRRYTENYDVVRVDPARPAVAVADGMGDGPGSKGAGGTTVETLFAALGTGTTEPARLREVVAAAQQRVRAIGRQLGMLAGCTLTALIVRLREPAEGWILHIGDSRAYRLRSGMLELLTSDHTAAWLGAVNGWYPADSPAAATDRYRLHRYVGHPADPEPDLLAVTLRPGDLYLLCTDGIAEQVPYHRMAEVLGGGQPPAEMVAALLDDAAAAGGRDNATATVIRVSTVE